eukprot:TRINITY_DN1411_c0_g1_i3.p1 TRINITY_DN1411_c0_g1~~TRINITY_DN1411_c0_g1_i3.p1  ORF type:complete len:1700 (-),score=404.63 TRINITY_DN1411_c0_g1_i3:208-5307(-)
MSNSPSANPLLAAAAAAAVGCAVAPQLFVQSTGRVASHGSSASLRGQQQAASTATPSSSSSSVPLLSVGAASGIAAVLAARAKGSKVPMRSGKMSPGFNTLPEWEKPPTGFEGNLGDQPPLGFWDPAGFAKDRNVELFKRRREVELKHGRVSMFATMGYITPEYFKFGGDLSPSQNLKFEDVPNGLKALAVVPKEGWAQIIAFIAFLELAVNKPTSEPGNYGKGTFGLGNVGFNVSVQEPEVRFKKLQAELANGRLAMVAIIGMFFQDGLTGSAWGDWALYTDSPLRAFESELGVQAPVGFWDPVGYTRDGNVETFKRRRETELKHGRVAMYATIGYITPEYFKWPGYLSPTMGLKFEDVPNGLAAISKVPGNGWAQIVAFAGYYELFVYKYNGTPGDYGWKAITSSDSETLKNKLSAELANGRLAMMAIIGMFFQDGLTGSAWGDWANYTDSPLRAFESELGVQAPVGFWDPAGFTKDGSAQNFARRRQTELKHGRISMLATMGYITPEFVGKWPGYLSPSNGLKYADIPNGLQAISKVPAAGWAQIIGWCVYCETSMDQSAGTPAAAGDFGWKVLTSSDPAQKTNKLAAELANGRLAMMAIIGMFFQDGLTGSAWGDWALYSDSPLRAFESELGVQAPVGFWDPAGFTKDGSAQNFARRRQTELKHGRISMLATMGYITPEFVGKWPGYLSPSNGLKYADIPNGLQAISKVPAAGWAQIIGWCVYCETSMDQSAGTPAAAGDFGWKVLTSSDPAQKTNKLAAELANGRLAMMAIIGMFFQDGLTGSAWGDWALYSDSPLRAFESELGVQAPVGFWDPAGLSADGNAENYARRRQTELKHGRIAMLATMGYITPEITGKFPGFLSPSLNLKFEDVPNGLAALSKVPSSGWMQILAYMAFCEVSQDQSPGTPAAAGDFGWKVLTSSDAAEKTKKLAAEIANGRLAMMAIIGMFFQDGLTGSAWGDWANYTDSPLRAFENELGVQAPLGFWDPAGLTKDGDEDDFRRRRITELKNGRVAMFATLGYIVPEYVRFPGFCSPSQGIKFEDIPNGLSALSKVPGAGWVQILVFCGAVERGLYYSDPSRAPGDYENGGVLGVPNGSTLPKGGERDRKLNAELANGRLAMVAIIGMFFQDGLTGSAWGDWELYTDSPLRGAFEGELGVQAPVGFWDPLGMSKDGDVATFKRRRETELKHGRVAMLATIGYIVPEFFKWPGYLAPSAALKFESIPNGLAACSQVPANGWLQIILFAGYNEVTNGYDKYTRGGTPGAYGWNAITSTDPEVRKRKLNAELANGRLAMMAIIGMFFQDGLTGVAWGDWSYYVDSPLRAFENELGVQAPVGFWDPAGFSKDGSAEDFRRRRETELKHGRVSMIATLGYIVPEYARFPGTLSPSNGLEFKDVPNGLAAISKVPSMGWTQTFLFVGLIDFAYFKSDPDRQPGDYANAGILGVPNGSGPIKNKEARDRKLNAELANGRLAMMAIMGMFFQDGLTGSAWGDWAVYVDSPLRAKSARSAAGTATSPGFDASKEVGAIEPFGYWDPAGLADGKDEQWFRRMRGAELKHGRVAMMAIVGFLGQHFWRFPGCFDLPDGVKTLETMEGSTRFACLFLIIGFFELRILDELEDKSNPGNFGDPLKVTNTTNGGYDERWRNFELSNGRLAMIGAIGSIVASAYTGLDPFDQWSTAKPIMMDYLSRSFPYAG